MFVLTSIDWPAVGAVLCANICIIVTIQFDEVGGEVQWNRRLDLTVKRRFATIMTVGLHFVYFMVFVEQCVHAVLVIIHIMFSVF